MVTALGALAQERKPGVAGIPGQMRTVTRAEREAARARLGPQKKGVFKLFAGINPATATLSPMAQVTSIGKAGPKEPALMGPALSMPDYFGIGNYANSPLPVGVPGSFTGGMRKFVDTLPGLCGVSAPNNLGQCIPIATADTTTFPGSDFYRIGLRDFAQQMHSDLPATRLRGYVQLDVNGNPVGQQQYLGPLLLATKNRPVRVLFENQLGSHALPVGTGPGANGDIFIPMDDTYMGAGTGPDGTKYTENRATLHLHGGNTPWISDGTPHQWITPASETASLKAGVSMRNVPDMFGGDPGPGKQTFYWTNQQGGRLMFYHDHAYGTTRLNVYLGEAAGYLLVDPVEENALKAATAPGTLGTTPDLAHLLPLIIQDRTWVPDDGAPGGQLAAQDPTWDVASYGGFGSLWYPHVYPPNQDPADTVGGANPFGRWDYGAWFWPPQNPSTYVSPPFPCPTAARPDQVCPGLPNPTGVPEGFMDTPVINGTAYPSTIVDPAAYRFQILNAANDRSWNLQFFYAATAAGVVCKGPGAPDPSLCTEVSMVPAIPHTAATTPRLCTAADPIDPVTGLPNPVGGCWPTTWPVDGRDGGVPDPATAGPAIISIGSEGGLLPAPAVIPAQPVAYEYNRRNIVVLDILYKSLFLMPAERQDVIVDFSSVPLGSTLILYNDAAPPIPAFDSRYDYYTGDLDQTTTGGAPTTQPGYGPNTRTIMQFRVTGTGANNGFNLATLQAAFNSTPTTTGIYAATQAPPIVPEPGYGPAFNATYPETYSKIFDTSLAYFNGALAGIALAPGGTGYTSAPTVTIAPPVSGVTATATAVVSGGKVVGLTVTNGGSGYTAAPAVTFGGPGVGATAVASVASGRVSKVILSPSGGVGYTFANVAISGGGATVNATATATVAGGTVTGFTLTNPGAGYTSAPTVTITGDGAGANAVALGQTTPMRPKAIQELFTLDYGRMNATLGVELPFTNFLTQTTIPYGYIDPSTEILKDGEMQIWKITHNGVDTHPVHFHLFNVQVINRVGWDGAIRPPDENELGWKDTVRMKPLEDVIVALLPLKQDLPWPLPDSIRPLDVTNPIGFPSAFTQIDPSNNPITPPLLNMMANFGQEYVWHCHILGHEENDFMRPMPFLAAPPAPTTLAVSRVATGMNLSWTDNSANESSFTIQRATDAAFTTPTNLTAPSSAPNTAFGGGMSFIDTTAAANTAYFYRAQAVDDNFSVASGYALSFNAQPALLSGWSNTVTTPAFTITTASPLPNGRNGTPYSQTFAATGAVAPYAWAVASGSLPGGLALSSAGVLSGTPTATGTFNFTIRATDSTTPTHNTTTKAFALTLLAPVITITTASPLPAGTVGTAYSQTFAGTGGTLPYSWTVSAGTLPGGLTLTTAGLLAGTPTAAGTFNFTIRVADAAFPANSTTKAFTLTINSVLVITTASPLPNGRQGQAYSQTFAATGGTAPLTWVRITGDAFPSGLGLNGTTGVLSGTPTVTGTFNFTIRVTDSTTPTARVATKAFTLTILAPAITITTASPLPNGTRGLFYSQALAATGGVTPYTWVRISGTYPPGISVNGPTGVLSGTPTTAGTYSFTIRVTDSTTPTAQIATKTFSLTILAGFTITTPSPLPSGTVGTAYSQTLASTGGVGPYTWVRVGGTYPPGISVNGPTGVLSGTPTTAGTYSFTIRVTDSTTPTAQVTTKVFSLTVN